MVKGLGQMPHDGGAILAVRPLANEIEVGFLVAVDHIGNDGPVRMTDSRFHPAIEFGPVHFPVLGV